VHSRYCVDGSSMAMHLNPSTNNKVGQLFQGDIHYCYAGPEGLPSNNDVISPGNGCCGNYEICQTCPINHDNIL
jgi:hypothetical protein